MSGIRVMIVDDSITIRAMLEQLLSNDGGCQVVAIASNADEAYKLMHTSRPDVITLDLIMPGIDGLQFLRDLRGEFHPPIIVLSSRSKYGAAETQEAIEAGAFACFDKGRLLPEFPEFLQALKKSTTKTAPGARLRIPPNPRGASADKPAEGRPGDGI